MESNIHTNTCIYRARCKNNKCCNLCDNNINYCKEHIKFKNIGFFDIINNACGNKIDLLNNKSIYDIFKEIFKYSDSEELKKKLFIRILAYLFSSANIKKIAKYNNLDEEEMAAKAIARLLSYGGKTATGAGADVEGAEEIETETETETETEEA